jgi:3-oxoacyl-[acyl-carrier-protein] synthase-3
LRSEVRPAGILAVGSYAPPHVLTNFDLEKMVDTSDEWIRTRTGIVERRLADPDMATSDLAYQATQAALESAGLEAADLDLIIVATVTPDMFFPCTASVLQQKLGPPTAGFDLLVGCSGFILGLVIAGEMVAAGRFEHILVCGAETLSRIIDWQDRSTCVLLGDAAGAVIVGPVDEGKGFLSHSMGNLGENGDALRIPAGGTRLPTTAQTVADRLHYMQMNGQAVFKFAVRAMAESSEDAVQKAGLEMDDIDLVVPHQANLRIIEAAAKRFKLPYERFVVNIDRYANTGAATIPVALDEALKEGRLKRGDNVLMSAFGAGLSWASMVMRW